MYRRSVLPRSAEMTLRTDASFGCIAGSFSDTTRMSPNTGASSERAVTVAASVGGFLCLAPSILAVTGIDSLFSDKSKGIALPLLLLPTAVALGFYFGKSTKV